MKRLVAILPLLLLLSVACSKAPRGVLDEDDMADLLVDFHKGEAYVDIHSTEYFNDSLRAVIKQSVLKKHGVTPEEFDSSLAWYGRNVDVYVDVYADVVQRLKKEYAGIKLDNVAKANDVKEGDADMSPAHVLGSDELDLWTQSRVRILSRHFADTVITLTLNADEGWRRGDVFTWSFRLLNQPAGFQSLMAVEYADGSVSYLLRSERRQGWNRIQMMTDSTREIKHVFGTLRFEIDDNDMVCVDSIQCVRTRLEKERYYLLYQQRNVGRKFSR